MSRRDQKITLQAQVTGHGAAIQTQVHLTAVAHIRLLRGQSIMVKVSRKLEAVAKIRFATVRFITIGNLAQELRLERTVLQGWLVPLKVERRPGRRTLLWEVSRLMGRGHGQPARPVVRGHRQQVR